MAPGEAANSEITGFSGALVLACCTAGGGAAGKVSYRQVRARVGVGGIPLMRYFVEELARPGGRVVIPEVLEGFLEKVGADGLQVVAEQITESEVLLVGEILAPFEQQPAGLLKEA